jgi:alpha-pyrone synthase
MILTAISDRLGLSAVHTESAVTVLRKFGNMSSATLIFVLRELLAQFEEGQSTSARLPAHCTPYVPALAFGPGLNVEGALLKYCGLIKTVSFKQPDSQAQLRRFRAFIRSTLCSH